MSKILSHIITTAPRPVPTLARSIESWRAGGFDEALTVCADGMDPPLTPGVNVVTTEKRGGLQSWVWALEYLILADPADWYMVVEDDVLWTRNAKAQLVDELRMIDPKGIGYISLYACRRVTSHLERETGFGHKALRSGYYESKLGWSTWGSQCLILPHSAASILTTDLTFREFVKTYAKNKNRDAVVSRALLDLKLRTMFRIPCLVNHALGANNSALGNKPVRPALECDYFQEAM